MTIEGHRPSDPSAPDALSNALHVFENTTNLRDHERTLIQVNAAITPLLQALSVPEVISRSDWKIDGILQPNLWRRTLSYSVQTTANDGNPYWIHATQIVGDGEVVERTILEATTYGPDGIPIASVGIDPVRKVPLVKNARGEIAIQSELGEITELVDFLVQEAPKQAVAKGKVSPHWMERYNAELPEDIGPNYKEGFPQNHSSKLYEVIAWNGLRSVCSVVTAGGEHGWKDQAGQLLWLEDVNQDVEHEESKIAAWREINPNGVLPDYYARLKYPSIYQHRDLTPKSAES